MDKQQPIKKREYYMDQEYFDSEVEYNDESLQKFEAIVADPNISQEHRTDLRYTIFKRNLEQLIARYSRGEAITGLRQAFPRIIDALAAYHSERGYEPVDFSYFDAYIRALWLVSLAVLFEVNDELMQKLLKELNNEGRDAIFERLVALRVAGRAIPATLMYPKPYKTLLDALNATQEEQTKLLQKFLKEYYKGMKKAYWYDTHLKKDSGFFGYWCFELAALVKYLHIDDQSFVDNMFYPCDLVKADFY